MAATDALKDVGTICEARKRLARAGSSSLDGARFVIGVAVGCSRRCVRRRASWKCGTAALHKRAGKAVTNFKATLATPQSDLAQETLKDPYVFDFLTLGPDAHERDLERSLLEHVRDFLLELGVGFAFVGSQVHLEVGSKDFFVDLLFFHLRLRCFVVIDLKTGEFKPEDAGKMNFYLSTVDDQLRREGDQPSIGLVLCKQKDKGVVEYALRDVRKPVGVAKWETRIVESLPKALKGSLPTVEELEAELAPKARRRS